jgi:negative regulator of flagellin synthesis FlgM
MEIDGNQGIGIDAYVNQVQDKNKVGTPDNKPEKTAIKADTVVLSDAAKRVQEARRQLNDIPDVREDKVSQLRSQIQNGTYEINADKIAGKMIKEGLLNDALK